MKKYSELSGVDYHGGVTKDGAVFWMHVSKFAQAASGVASFYSCLLQKEGVAQKKLLILYMWISFSLYALSSGFQHELTW